jgi:hypothetical protein
MANNYKQGKVKSIPVIEVIEGMQVIDPFGNIAKVITPIPQGEQKLTHFEVKCRDGVTRDNASIINQLKTLVVEYEEEQNKTWEQFEFDKKADLITKQIPLKWKQWEAAIDNGEVDSDKTVQFEILRKFASMKLSNEEYYAEYAKIIPQRAINFQEKYKNIGKRPTEDQQLEKLADLLTSHDVRKHLNINSFGYSQVERDIVKLFNNMLK